MSLLGKSAPDFTVENTGRKQVALSETLESGPTVIVVFRAGWCSFCAEQLQTFSNLAYDLWFNHDTDVVSVSSDSIGNLTEMRDRYELTIQLCSDPDFEVTETYTERKTHPRRADYSRSGLFVVDAEGTVRYEHVSEAANDRTYANSVRYFIDADYEDRFGHMPGSSL